jgi:hypothetical protein
MNALAVALTSVMISVPIESVLVHAESSSPAKVWNFDHERPGVLPSEFSIGTLLCPEKK